MRNKILEDLYNAKIEGADLVNITVQGKALTCQDEDTKEDIQLFNDVLDSLLILGFVRQVSTLYKITDMGIGAYLFGIDNAGRIFKEC